MGPLKAHSIFPVYFDIGDKLLIKNKLRWAKHPKNLKLLIMVRRRCQATSWLSKTWSNSCSGLRNSSTPAKSLKVWMPSWAAITGLISSMKTPDMKFIPLLMSEISKCVWLHMLTWKWLRSRRLTMWMSLTCTSSNWRWASKWINKGSSPWSTEIPQLTLIRSLRKLVKAMICWVSMTLQRPAKWSWRRSPSYRKKDYPHLKAVTQSNINNSQLIKQKAEFWTDPAIKGIH